MLFLLTPVSLAVLADPPPDDVVPPDDDPPDVVGEDEPDELPHAAASSATTPMAAAIRIAPDLTRIPLGMGPTAIPPSGPNYVLCTVAAPGCRYQSVIRVDGPAGRTTKG